MGKAGRSLDGIKMYSALEAANICGVVNQTAINWIKNGYLKAFKTPGGQYRIYKNDLLEFMQERRMHIPASVYSRGSAGTNKSLIVINGDEEENNSLFAFLSMQLPSFEVYQAFNSFTAGLMLARFTPAFVFLDFDCSSIPVSDICTQIKNDAVLDRAYIIVSTSAEVIHSEKNILQLGVDLIFKKPLDYIKMLTELHKLACIQ